MATYRLRVRTGAQPLAGTLDAVAVTLVGTRGRSPRTLLDHWGLDFACGSRGEYRVHCPRTLGQLLLLRVHKGPFGGLPESAWFLESVTAWLEGTGTATPPPTPPTTPEDSEDEEGDSEGEQDENEDEEDEEDKEDEEDEEAAGDTDDAGDTEDEVAGDSGDTWGNEDMSDTEDAGDIENTYDTDDTGDTDEAEATSDTDDAEASSDPGAVGDPGDTGDAEDMGDPEDAAPAGPFHFPCYRWLRGWSTWELPEGTARTPAQERHPLLQRLRRRHLAQQRRRYRLAPFAPGLPWALPEGTPPDPDLQYSLPKLAAFYLRGGSANLEAKLRGFLDRPSSWPSLEAVTRLFRCFHTPVTEYVVRHWRDDAFFGEQFLSGVNPVLLRRCARLPPNFPVTPPMVAASLGPASSLQPELEKGTIFLADYALLAGVPTGRLGGHPQFLAAPLCLLWLSPQGQLLPIAIQLSQRPGPDAPIFVPGDGPWRWALAKLWVRGAHFLLHELVTHLLQSHFLGEAFALATLRLPACHPLHQLLLPHCRFTFHINILARETLLSPGGIIDQATAVGREGTLELVARGTAALTYRELCVPDDLEDRGVTDIPNYHYRDDALEIWGAIESLAEGIVALYYPEDSDVAEDYELQDWVGEIFTYAVLGNEKSGFPSKLCSRPELVKFVTMIIFCCSARHAAVNSGQYDYAAWMPNTPGTLQRPPPRRKDEATAELLLRTLPSPAATGALLALLSVVSYEGGEPRPLGSRSEEPLTGAAPRRLVATFRHRLATISQRIQRRNEGLALPYPYLDPACVTESVSI